MPCIPSGVVPVNAPLFTRPFVMTCLSAFLFYLSFYLILPVMPLYVASMGGTPFQIGLIIGLFAFTAMLLRPPAGWVIDTRGSRMVLVTGMAIFFLASLAYVAARSVTAILLLRLFHGVGMGLFPTAATVVVAEVTPPARRGEAMGWFGIANSVGLIVGPASGAAIAAGAGSRSLFLLAGAAALLGMACIWLIPGGRESTKRQARPPRLADFFSRAAVLPSVLLLFLYVPYGGMFAFIPIVARDRGLVNPGTYFTVFAVAVLLVRGKAGHLSDRLGRTAAIVPGMLLAAAALVVLGVTSGRSGVLGGAVLFGLGFGSAQPALMALTADRVPAEERGKAMGTFYTAWELGIMTGATGTGLLLTVTDFPVMLLAGSLLPVAGALLSLRARPVRSATP